MSAFDFKGKTRDQVLAELRAAGAKVPDEQKCFCGEPGIAVSFMEEGGRISGVEWFCKRHAS